MPAPTADPFAGAVAQEADAAGSAEGTDLTATIVPFVRTSTGSVDVAGSMLALEADMRRRAAEEGLSVDQTTEWLQSVQGLRGAMVDNSTALDPVEDQFQNGTSGSASGGDDVIRSLCIYSHLATWQRATFTFFRIPVFRALDLDTAWNCQGPTIVGCYNLNFAAAGIPPFRSGAGVSGSDNCFADNFVKQTGYRPTTAVAYTSALTTSGPTYAFPFFYTVN